MKIHFSRTGGFAGTRLAVTLDTEKLPAQEAERLRSLVEAASLFALPPSIESSAPGADRFRYQITVEEGGREQRVAMDDSSAPQACRSLLDHLLGAARAERKSGPRRKKG